VLKTIIAQELFREWGGDVSFVGVSASLESIESALEAVLLQSEVA